eukprot:TRINITY_DN31418_c0_g1_i1.p1 TRINITY_DN31418_c0_g1~~TRINITY_DN31418_c0_g1_i1.p1  ORF type:complete len:292 (+),score=113.47 TRINITY_DN31418_c0_g1_i1:109-984(+)
MGGWLDEQTQKEARQKLRRLQDQLEQIEELKRKEPSIRREISALKSKLGDNALLVDEDDGAQNQNDAMDPQKRLKTLNKKLQQIASLKQKAAAGETLDSEAKAKVASEARLLREVEAIKAGDIFDEEKDAIWAAENEVPRADLPTDKAEVEKRLKALKKKIVQIETLKGKGDENLDADAKAKVKGERRILQEINALERGENEVVFHPPTEEEKIEEAMKVKLEVDKKIKALRKKLSQIDALKAKGTSSLDASERAKIDSEASLKKDLGALERELGVLNKLERDRVAKRLGH